MKKFKIGLIREEKSPADSRVPITPIQAKQLMEDFPVEIVVEPSPDRCYKDEEYAAMGINLTSQLKDCDVLMGVKEIPKEKFIEGKQYYFFSHTIKKQPYNKEMLQKILQKKVTLVDYECLRTMKGQRIIGFGRYAGIVGAHNALRAYGLHHKLFDLKAAHDARDLNELKGIYQETDWPTMKILSTGNGKVAHGASELLRLAGIREVSPEAYKTEAFDEAVFAHSFYKDMYAPKEGGDYNRDNYYTNPATYECNFEKYYQTTDIFINGIYWEPAGPKYFSLEEMNQADFKISVIADVTCDIAPESSVPSTLRPTKIGDDLMGFDPKTGKEVPKFSVGSITLMSVDNLPNELPRDASQSFGESIRTALLPEMLKENSEVIARATIATNGQLGEHYQYLKDYIA